MAGHDRHKGLIDDVLIEILILLPTKSLLQFGCVSKTWCSLIKSSKFIDRHLKLDRKGVLLLMRVPPPPDCENWCEPDAINNSEDTQGPTEHVCTFSDPTNHVFSFCDPDYLDMVVSPDVNIPNWNDELYGLNYYSLAGPCNGLVCLAFRDTYILCNPALREFELLPPRDFMYTDIIEGSTQYTERLGIGFDRNTNVYKIVCIGELWYWDSGTVTDMFTRAAMFSSSTNSWRQIHDASLSQLWGDHSGLCLKDILHWYETPMDETYLVILTFDISTEIFGKFEFPIDTYSNSNKHKIALKVLNDCLSLVSYRKSMTKSVMIEIWVMTEYGIKESSVKQFVIGPYILFDPILFLNKEQLLLETGDGHFASLDLYSNDYKEFDIDGLYGYREAIIYKESLISPNQLLLGDKYN